ncbi:MAG: 2-oxo acid dehydrogenase subunit E2 [Chloroflexi bacterium]|nr:2-oxo acid dehydrogenase subunit E2 [Chloroflexota bacterium]
MPSITMPQLGESVAEGTIGKWLKRLGDRVARDEPLVEVMTDKVTAEIPSPFAGVLKTIVVPEGETVPIGGEIAVVEVEDAQAGQDPVVGEGSSGVKAPQACASSIRISGDAPSVRAPSDGAPDLARPAPHLRASPLVRKLVEEHGLALRDITGTGAGGRVTKDDVLAFIARPVEQRPPTTLGGPMPAGQPAPSPAKAEEDDEIPLSPMRRSIAEHMVRSVHTAPHAWSMVEVDATPLVRYRESLVPDWHRREGFELTLLPFFAKCVVEALREHPLLNATWADDRIVVKGRVNLGIAVSVEDGLLVPVIRDADRLSIAGLALAIHDLTARARAGRLTLPDVQDGTFTVNNTGALGSIVSQPIIPQPQAGIVTMEAVVKRPVVIDDAIAIRSIMNVCLSFDHRVLDGAGALRFLQSVRRRVEGLGPGPALY